MATIQFPDPTSLPDGYTFEAENGVTYTLDKSGGGGWTAYNSEGLDDRYVEINGDTMTGDLTVGGYPSSGSNEGANIRTSGLIVSARTGSDKSIWVGYTTGTSTYTSRISNEGDAIFLGDVLAGQDPTNGDNSGCLLQADGDATFAGDIQSTSQNGGQLAGFRNQLINGDFRVWQRGASIINTGKGALYTADRWTFSSFSASSGVIMRTSDSAVGFSYALQAPVEAAALIQAVELDKKSDGSGLPDPFILGSTWTLSVYCNQDLNGTSTNANFRVGATNSAGQTNAGRLIWAAEGTADANGFTRYVATFTVEAVPDAVNTITCLTISIPGPNTTGAETRYSGAQLERGSVATPFEHRLIGTEWSLCQRYFVRNYLGSRVISEGLGAIITAGGFDGNIYPYVNYLPPMRNVLAATNLVADITKLECATRNNTTSGGSTIRNAGVRLRGEAGLYQISLGCSNGPANATFFVGMGGNYSVSAEL